MQNDEICEDQIIIGKTLGTGGEASVYECKIQNDPQPYALKEYNILSLLQNSPKDSLIKIYTLQSRKSGPQLIMEEGREDFQRFMVRNEYQNLSTLEKTGYFLQMVKAVIDMHSLNKIHRDLKPENFLCFGKLNEKNIIKLSDFGLAKDTEQEIKTFCGTGAYLAPEIDGEHLYDKSADIWSLGIIWLQMMANIQFKKKNCLRHKSQQDIKQFVEDSTFPLEFQKILLQMIVLCPQQRMNLQSIEFNIENILNQSNQLKDYTFVIQNQIKETYNGQYFKGEILENQMQVVIYKRFTHPNIQKVQLLKILQQQKFQYIANIIGIREDSQTFYIVREQFDEELKDQRIKDPNLQISIFQDIVKIIIEIQDFNLFIGSLSFKDFTYSSQKKTVKLKKLSLKAIRSQYQNSFFNDKSINLAPEIATNFYSEKVDIWSLGLLFYQLITEQMNQSDEFLEINDNTQIQIDNKINNLNIDLKYKDILKKMLKIQPQDRSHIKEISFIINLQMDKINNQPAKQQLNLNQTSNDYQFLKNDFQNYEKMLSKINNQAIFCIDKVDPLFINYFEYSQQIALNIQELLTSIKIQQDNLDKSTYCQYTVQKQAEYRKKKQNLDEMKKQLDNYENIILEQLKKEKQEKVQSVTTKMQVINQIVTELDKTEDLDKTLYNLQNIFKKIVLQNHDLIQKLDQQEQASKYKFAYYLKVNSQVQNIIDKIIQQEEQLKNYFEKEIKNIYESSKEFFINLNQIQAQLNDDTQLLTNILQMKFLQFYEKIQEIKKEFEIKIDFVNLISSIPHLNKQLDEIKDQLKQIQIHKQQQDEKVLYRIQELFKIQLENNQNLKQLENKIQQQQIILQLFEQKINTLKDKSQQINDNLILIDNILKINSQVSELQFNDVIAEFEQFKKQYLQINQEVEDQIQRLQYKETAQMINQQLSNLSELVNVEDLKIELETFQQQLSNSLQIDQFQQQLERLTVNFKTLEIQYLQKKQQLEDKLYQDKLQKSKEDLKTRIQEMISKSQTKYIWLINKLENFNKNQLYNKLNIKIEQEQSKYNQQKKQLNDFLDRITSQCFQTQEQLDKLNEEILDYQEIQINNQKQEQLNQFNELQVESVQIQYNELIKLNVEIESQLPNLNISIEEIENLQQKYNDLLKRFIQEDEKLNQISLQCKKNLNIYSYIIFPNINIINLYKKLISAEVLYHNNFLNRIKIIKICLSVMLQ